MFLRCLFIHPYIYFTQQIDTGNEALENNFVKLVQRLLEDPKERGHFLKVSFDILTVCFVAK